MKRWNSALAILIALCLAAPASAHFLWLNKVRDPAGKAKVQLCFSEEASPGEAELVDKVATAQLWQQIPGEKPALLKTEKVVDGETACFTSPLANEAAALSASWDYGVISRNDKTFLLQYYAKHLDASRADELKQFARSDKLRLDVVPVISGENCELAILFDGKPAPADSQVMVAAEGEKQVELKTDAEGKVNFKLGSPGKHEIRARVKHDKAGEREGKAYTHEMHYTTLVLVTGK